MNECAVKISKYNINALKIETLKWEFCFCK